MSINTQTTIDSLLAELQHERLRAISLIRCIDGEWLNFVVTTTKREIDMLVSGPQARLVELVAQANQCCIGQRVVYLTVNEAPYFELVLKNGFSIRTLN